VVMQKVRQFEVSALSRDCFAAFDDI